MPSHTDRRRAEPVSRGARRLLALTRSGALTVATLDALRISLAFLAAVLLRFDGNVPAAHWSRFLTFLPVVVVVHLVAFWRLRIYEQVWRHASIIEATRICTASAGALGVLLAYDLAQTPRVPVSVVVLGSLFTVLLTGAARFSLRLLTIFNGRRKQGGSRPSVIVIGDDVMAALVIRSMREGEHSPVPIAVLAPTDEDTGRSLLGVPIVGAIEALAETARKVEPAYALLAVDNPTRDIVQRAQLAAETARLPLKIVPDRRAVLQGLSIERAIRNVNIADLLGREPVRIAWDSLRASVSGKRVLITGGGGWIGSEIARQMAMLGPSTIHLLDHDETHLFEAAAGIEGSVEQVLADIRDAAAIDEIFATRRPEIVFHAAAHKHVPLLEAHPCEAAGTNVLGTLNVLEAAARHEVPQLVFVSTDKAVDPTSIMGSSKWIGERLVSMYAPAGSRWCAVRFGNVLGSRGSVIPTFTRQIEAGGPVTVTDARMTRYFMSTQEAVQLVLQAADLAHGGETFMLEMGQAVNILDLAHKMIRLSGSRPDVDIPVVITGIRPGEKLDEQLYADDEQVLETAHESIHRVLSSSIEADELLRVVEKLAEVVAARDDAAAAAMLLSSPGRLHSEYEAGWNRATT